MSRVDYVLLCTAAALAAGALGCDANLGERHPYAGFIGREYRIVGDVDAYGIKEELQDDQASYVTLIPLPGIGGPEVVFQRRIARGTIFRIRDARQRFYLFDNGTEYIVDLMSQDVPKGIEVRIGLFRGNERGPVDLNPGLYERLPN
jgi:hypothetical protein